MDAKEDPLDVSVASTESTGTQKSLLVLKTSGEAFRKFKGEEPQVLDVQVEAGSYLLVNSGQSCYVAQVVSLDAHNETISVHSFEPAQITSPKAPEGAILFRQEQSQEPWEIDFIDVALILSEPHICKISSRRQLIWFENGEI